ncbi:Hypothetical protein D9617_8g050790 [Elsinoe fawcettii]|nr:Hypothetical protein D9617_8g050790 [Elsinoe fawcettii]
MDEQVSELEAEYCPPIDTAVLLAIISDYDLTDTASFAEARATLDLIKADAEIEQAAADLDAPATVGADHNGDHTTSSSRLGSEETDVTSLSNDMSQLSTGSVTPPSGDFTEDENFLQRLDQDAKAALLADLFTSVSPHTIKHVLQKVESNWNRAMDELLNISSFDSPEHHDGTPISAKGIDAFMEDQVAKRGRKKKRKGTNHRVALDDRRANSLPSSPVVSSSANPWKSTSGDVEFLARHTKLSTNTVQTAYNANGASVAGTITGLLDDMSNSASKVTSSNATIQANAVELGRDFPTIAPHYLTALIQLTHPSTSSAHALATALTAKPPPPSSGPIVPHYKPLSLSDDESSSPSSSRPTSVSLLTATPASALSHRDTHRLLSSQAAAAYRRSRSNPLYGGAAAYYASEARDARNIAAAHGSAAADAQVASQSSLEQLDLHGTVVADAVRIAKRETAAWWASLGEARVGGRLGAAEREKGYRIVVGLGRHSEGGKSRIGPAVHKALVAEGWRVEGGTGVLTVRGRRV